MKNEVTGTWLVANKGVTMAVSCIKDHQVLSPLPPLSLSRLTREAKERHAGIEDVAWQGSNLGIDSNRVGYS